MGVRDIKAGKAWVELGLHNTAFVRGLVASENRLRAFGRRMSAIGNRMMIAGTALAGVLVGAAIGFAKMGDNLDKMSSRVGASVEFLSALSHAAQIGGSDINAMEVGVRRMQRTALDATRGLSTAVDAFGELGVSVVDAEGKLKPTEALFMETVSALSQVESATKKAALAQMVFGRAGTSLLPMLKDGKEGLLGVMKEAETLGIVMSTEDATAAAEFTDQMLRISSVMKRMVFDVGAAVAEVFQKHADQLIAGAKAAGQWIAEHHELIATGLKWAVGLVAVGAALKFLANGFIVAAGAVKVFSTALAFTLAHPVVAALVGTAVVLTGLAYAIHKATSYTAQLTDEMTKLREAGDAQRTVDQGRLNRLEQLAAKEHLNNAEMVEARGLIGKLEDQYGDLGMSVNEATGKIDGFTSGLKATAEAMRDLAAVELRREIREIEKNIRELEAQAHSFGKGFWQGFTRGAGVGRAAGVGFGYDPGAPYIDAELEQIAKYQRQLEELRGDRAGLTAPGERSDLAARSAEAARLDESMAKRLRDLRIQAIDDEYGRAVAAINERYDLELRRAEELGADIGLVEQARQREIAAAAEARRQRERDAAQALADEELRINEDVQLRLQRAEIKADSSLTAAEKHRAQLRLDYQREYFAAVAAGVGGEGLERIKRLYELKEGMLAGADGAETRIAGTFSARAAAKYLGGAGGDPQLKSIEDNTADAAEILNKIESNTARGLVWG